MTVPLPYSTPSKTCYWWSQQTLRRLHYRYLRPLPQKLSFLFNRLRFGVHDGYGRQVVDFSTVRNVLDNCGAIPAQRVFHSGEEVLQETGNRAGVPRAQGIRGFEGFAPDDAVYDEELDHWRIWSYERLALAIAKVGYSINRCPKILELGSGAGQLFRFLKAFGIPNYVGIDGSPYLFDLNPFCRDNQTHFLTLNLQEEIRLMERAAPFLADIVCSFEVLEHIREEKVEYLLRSIRSHMHVASVALLTASQLECDVHVLVRPAAWWLARFRSVGLEPHPRARDLVDLLAKCHPHNWSAGTSLIFALIPIDSHPAGPCRV